MLLWRASRESAAAEAFMVEGGNLHQVGQLTHEVESFQQDFRLQGVELILFLIRPLEG